MKLYYVYIMASRQRAIYIGITGNFEKRMKQLKSWRRGKKVRLIESTNPEWADLSAPPALPAPSLRSG